METAAQAGTSTWRLDPAHSSVEFSVKHMMMTTVRGRFKEVEATLTADEEHPEGCCVEATLQVASIDTGMADRDAHLRSADFFDAERHPTITFRSRRLEGKFGGEGDRFQIVGDLAILGDRREWGLKWNQVIETGGVLVANKVRIEAEVQFVRE